MNRIEAQHITTARTQPIAADSRVVSSSITSPQSHDIPQADTSGLASQLDPANDQGANAAEALSRLRFVVENYLSAATRLGVVRGLLVGQREGEKQVYIWNILSSDIPVDQPAPPELEELGQLAHQFRKELRDTVPLRISTVNPSDLKVLKRHCAKLRIRTELLE